MSGAAPAGPGGGLRTVSYGGGVQSTALLVLAAEQRIDFRVFLFANVGEDSEDPATLTYVREHAAPFAAAQGIELHELHRRRRDGTTETLFGRLTREGSRSLPIPVRMSNGAPGTRSCCMRIITAAGLPVPPKSSCWFCPFHRPSTWAQMRRDRPALFTRAAALETLLNQRRAELGKDPVFLTRFNRPLLDAVPIEQDPLPGLDHLDQLTSAGSDVEGPEDDATCDNGACWT